GIVFYIGVAFVGKHAPASYEKEPWRRYDVATALGEALAAPEDLIDHVPADDRRDATKHQIAVDMRVELLDENAKVVTTEQTVSEEISPHGATLFTTLDLDPGRFIRLTSEQYRITLHAAIRSRNIGPDGIARIHVEFIDREWPL
ncbi:MAG TPA: hypothetical protein VFY51_00265, partial [Pyrinomonadaceae bacterium]|nr:hypothetical protein [Pyrinomonadaceae bacterium]